MIWINFDIENSDQFWHYTTRRQSYANYPRTLKMGKEANFEDLLKKWVAEYVASVVNDFTRYNS